MEVRDLDSWRSFRDEVATIREQYGWFQFESGDPKKNVVLFRGQSDSTWGLSTTLERAGLAPMTVNQYALRAARCSNELESLTDRKWNVPDYPEISREIAARQSDFHVFLPCYDYLVYLRHCGFPSPLLDWTESPYIAAFFAFEDKGNTERVAVYAFIDRPGLVKSKSGDDPFIQVMGPFTSTHARHFAQKAWYSVAARFDEADQRHTFCAHSEVFKKDPKEQDILIKITMPASERQKALQELSDYNINPFTLFQTEDALVRTLAMKEFDLRQV